MPQPFSFFNPCVPTPPKVLGEPLSAPWEVGSIDVIARLRVRLAAGRDGVAEGGCVAGDVARGIGAVRAETATRPDPMAGDVEFEGRERADSVALCGV